MKKIGVIPNLDKDKDLLVTKDVISFLLEKECTPLISFEVAQRLSLLEYGYCEEDMYHLADFFVVLGGDGTILGEGRKAAYYGVPLLGINLGTLGYLTDSEVADYKKSIERVLQGRFNVEHRLMLEARIYNENGIMKIFSALNDVCITRGVFSKIVDLHLYVNREYLDTIRADGVIIATPTGSTAYNLSAGGPVLKPDTRIIAITPICPHSLHARSIVISADDKVTIEIDGKLRGDLLLSADGQKGVTLDKNDIVRVQCSQHTVPIIKTNDYGFYDILRNKLMGN